MAYQEKYYFTFKPTGIEETHRVELWQDTGDVLIAEEVTAGVPPFSVDLPEISNKFQVIRGTGCVINLLSDTDMKFFDGLYHVNFKEFKVFHYIEGVLNWIGYLNSEMYREPYDQCENYITETSGNDGLNLMDRLFYNESDDSNYDGLESEWSILQTVFEKVGLEYKNIKVSLSTTFADFSGDADKTILHESYVQNENFYDEDNKPMTIREVAESILAPYGAFMIQSDGSIYITDVQTMAANTSVTYQIFNTSTFAYINTAAETNEFAVSSVGYIGTGQQIEISGGKNRQVVVYSPYNQKDVTSELLVTPDEFETVPPSFSSKDGYVYRTLEDHIVYDMAVGSQFSFEESAESLGEGIDHFVYSRIARASSEIPTFALVSNLNLGKVAIQSAQLRDNLGERVGSRRYFDGAGVLISGRALLKTKDNPYNPTYSPADIARGADVVDKCLIQMACSIGTYYYNPGGANWIESLTLFTIPVTKGSNQSIGNEWINFSIVLPVNVFDEQTILSGTLQIVVTDQISTTQFGQDPVLNNDDFQELWIGNLKVGVVNKDGSELPDTDVEYIAELDKSFREEADKITLTTGTESQFADRAKILRFDGNDYFSIEEWTRAGQTFKIEELLLGSLSSNYRAGYVTLTGMKLKNSIKPINILTDTYITDRKMITKSVNISYYDNRYEATLEEITEDELIIVP